METFNRIIEIQSLTIGRDPNALMRDVAKAVYNTAKLAASDVSDNKPDAPIYAIPADTGTGKTTASCGVMVAMYEANPDYTAAFVTPTISEAQSVHDILAKFLPETALHLHTSAHASNDTRSLDGATRERVAEHVSQYGLSSVNKLRKHRIVICTHEHWINEGLQEADLGIRQFNSHDPRSNVFIDERPDLTSIQQAMPSDIKFLHEQISRGSEWTEAAEVIDAVYDKMLKLCAANGDRFENAPVVDQSQYAPLLAVDLKSLAHESDFARTSATMKFLENASNGNCFISRDHLGGEVVPGIDRRMSFVTYSSKLRSHPGMILLDATVNLTAAASIIPKVRVVEVQGVKYSNLSLTHIEAPDQFANIANLAATRETDDDYLRWVKKTVKEQSVQGESVLVVVHKRHLNTLTHSSVPEKIHGREIHYSHWGVGIGSNLWRDCNSVFLFGEYHLPRIAYLSETLSQKEGGQNDDDFKSALGQCMRGKVAETAEGHRLYWLKQIACRGNVRNVAVNGACGRMKLFTTADLGLLSMNRHKLFPGAPNITHIRCKEIVKKTKPRRLNDLLIGTNKTEICASEIAAELNCPVKDVSKVFKSPRCDLLRYEGWELVSGNGRSSKPVLKKKPIEISAEVLACLA